MWTVGEAHTILGVRLFDDDYGSARGSHRRNSLPRPDAPVNHTPGRIDRSGHRSGPGVRGRRGWSGPFEAASAHRWPPTEPVPLGDMADDESTHLTQATFERLQAELEDLTTRGRVEIARAIEAARALGDLSENGDYHAAKDTQGKMESRVRRLQHTLGHAVIVDDAAVGSSETVSAGSVVAIRYEGDEEIERFLVGSIEERHDELNVVSPGSPLGLALLGKTSGDVVEYESPGGTLRVEIVQIGS
jgi:transcription elongation factor GreA